MILTLKRFESLISIFVSNDPIGNDDGILLSNSFSATGLYMVLLLQQYLKRFSIDYSYLEFLLPCFIIKAGWIVFRKF